MHAGLRGSQKNKGVNQRVRVCLHALRRCSALLFLIFHPIYMGHRWGGLTVPTAARVHIYIYFFISVDWKWDVASIEIPLAWFLAFLTRLLALLYLKTISPKEIINKNNYEIRGAPLFLVFWFFSPRSLLLSSCLFSYRPLSLVIHRV